MSARDAIAETAKTLHAARKSVNDFAANVRTPEARALLAVVVEHTITALSALRDQLRTPLPHRALDVPRRTPFNATTGANS